MYFGVLYATLGFLFNALQSNDIKLHSRMRFFGEFPTDTLIPEAFMNAATYAMPTLGSVQYPYVTFDLTHIQGL